MFLRLNVWTVTFFLRKEKGTQLNLPYHWALLCLLPAKVHGVCLYVNKQTPCIKINK